MASKTTIVVGVTVGVAATVAAVVYRKEIKAQSKKIAAGAMELFKKKAPAAEVTPEPVAAPAPAAEVTPEPVAAPAPAAEVTPEPVAAPAPAAEVTPEPVAEVIVIEVIPPTEVSIAQAKLDEITVDVIADREELSPEASAAVVEIVTETEAKVEELQVQLEEEKLSPEEVQKATADAILKMVDDVGRELMAEEAVSKVSIEPAPVINQEIAAKLEQAMKTMPNQQQPYRQRHNGKRHQRR